MAQEISDILAQYTPSLVWRRRDAMETLSTPLTLREGSPPVTGGFPHGGLAMLGLDISFVVSLNKLVKEQSSWHCDLRRVCDFTLTKCDGSLAAVDIDHAI